MIIPKLVSRTQITLYYLRIVVIEGYGVNSSQVAWFPLASTWFPVRHSKPQPQLGDKSDWNYNTWSYMQLSYFSWFIIKRTWSEEGLGDVEVGWFITRLDDGLSSGLNQRPSFKWNNTIIVHSYDIYNYISLSPSFHLRHWLCIFTGIILWTVFLLFGALYIYGIGHVNNRVAFPASSGVILQIEGWDTKITQ